MADDQIRAALREAVQAVIAEEERDAHRGPLTWGNDIAAAAIAAFLQALPAQFTTGRTAWGGDWPTLAAAVERAARQEGEGG